MSIDKEITITIRPWRWALNLAVWALLLWFVGQPTHMSVQASVPPPKPPPTAAYLARMDSIALVRSELGPRIKGADAEEVERISEALVDEATVHGFDPLFVLAIIEAESGYDVDACSGSRAKGLMQIMPATFHSVSDGKIFDPVENVRAGIRYLSGLSKTFHRPESILMAYNGGPTRATSYLRALQAKDDVSGYPQEMIVYPGKVMSKYTKLLAKNGKDTKLAHKLFRRPPAMIAMR